MSQAIDHGGFSSFEAGAADCTTRPTPSWKEKLKSMTGVVSPDGRFIFWWLLVVSVAVEYNLWTLILRQSFTAIQVSLTIESAKVDSLY